MGRTVIQAAARVLAPITAAKCVPSGIEVTDVATPAAGDWQVVQTEAGPVTLASIEVLRSRAAQLHEWAAKASPTAATLHDQAAEHFAAAGAILVPRSKEWSVPQALQSSVDRAAALVTQISDSDRLSGDLKMKQSQGGVFDRFGAWRQGRAVRHDRSNEAAQLRALLVEISKSAPTPTLPEADAEVASGKNDETQAEGLDQQIQAVKASADQMNQEVSRRNDAMQAMGFDSLYEAAVLQTSGPSPVDSPLVLHSGETAYLSVPATLARYVTRTHYVGGSSGFSFPIGHTGIRYRVGAFHGQPVQQQALAKLEAGTFVLTNQRVAFIGHSKSTNTALGKLMHVEVFTDGISVFQEGKESPDFYLMAGSRHAVFLLNWCLGKLMGGR